MIKWLIVSRHIISATLIIIALSPLLTHWWQAALIGVAMGILNHDQVA